MFFAKNITTTPKPSPWNPMALFSAPAPAPQPTSWISASFFSSTPKAAPAPAGKMFGAFLFSTSFWSRLGFLISYIATFFLVLEILRLVYTDVNKREVEKFLESYSKSRTSSPRRTQEARKTPISIPLENLHLPTTPPRRPSNSSRAAATPESDKTLVHDHRTTALPDLEKLLSQERRRRAHSTASRDAHVRPSSPAPVRKIRKRSDTLNSASSSETRRPARRHRETSPASEAGSKVSESSRHASPRRSKEERERKGLGLGKLMRGKV